MHAALAVLLGLNGLRVSEACGANIDDLGHRHRHRIAIAIAIAKADAGDGRPSDWAFATHAA